MNAMPDVASVGIIARALERHGVFVEVFLRHLGFVPWFQWSVVGFSPVIHPVFVIVGDHLRGDCGHIGVVAGRDRFSSVGVPAKERIAQSQTSRRRHGTFQEGPSIDTVAKKGTHKTSGVCRVRENCITSVRF